MRFVPAGDKSKIAGFSSGVAEDFSRSTSPLPLRQLQAGFRSFGSGIWRDFRIPGMDQSLRCAGRRGPIRQDRPGHIFLLDSFLARAASAEIHRLRRQRAIKCAIACIARDLIPLLVKQMQTAAKQCRRESSMSAAELVKAHVPARTERLVRDTIRRTQRFRINRDCGHSTSPGWCWIPRWPKESGVGRRKLPRSHLEEIADHAEANPRVAGIIADGMNDSQLPNPTAAQVALDRHSRPR